MIGRSGATRDDDMSTTQGRDRAQGQGQGEALTPFYENVQAHYDLSDELFFLFLDASRVYSCAYFERDDITLDEAQAAKIDLALGKLDLRSGMTLLDIGCGWGACCLRAAERYGVRAIGLTLSENQAAHAQRAAQQQGGAAPGSVEIRLRGWEEFDEPVDRIVSIGAFEHFRRERYAAFFERARALLPAEGRMLLHTIVWPSRAELAERGLPTEHEHVLFAKFIRREIFPGGQLCNPEEIIALSERAGFTVERVQALRLHYARTLGIWADRLESQKGRAIEIAGEAVYERYMKYMRGCSRYFAEGRLDVMQFTLACA